MDLYNEVLAHRAHAVTPCADIRSVLEQLQGTIPLAVFTGASRRAAQILLGALGMLDHFSVLVGGDKVEKPKPDPAGIPRACSLIPVDIDRAMHVGDAPTDPDAARRTGVMGAAAGWGHLYDATAPADLLLRSPGELLVYVSAAEVATAPDHSD
ncbi:HAD family hydrolase [Streptomyces sp. TRM70350]|uniref:HAD family hydrolase n=1 Tax=Streptomyces sp. TRM70350 TaxID=2856165 RepID=UPI001C4715F8|nr:HAD-IA family hydrolase [Streptomyces sp. TRM70350]MBV7700799.1 HAD-IA family hydrolase [Streptomyces sp. TRM70350]